MALVMTSGPASEPVTVAEAKAHMRIDGTVEDVLIASLIVTSRLHVDLALINQSWTLILDRWPPGPEVDIPLAPLQAVNAVKVKNSAGVPSTVSPTNYLVDLASKPPRIVWNNAARADPGVPAGGIEIEFAAGFGASAANVPAPLKHAVLMLTAHWYEHRDANEIGASAARIPDAISDLIQPFRKIRL